MGLVYDGFVIDFSSVTFTPSDVSVVSVSAERYTYGSEILIAFILMGAVLFFLAVRSQPRLWYGLVLAGFLVAFFAVGMWSELDARESSYANLEAQLKKLDGSPSFEDSELKKVDKAAALKDESGEVATLIEGRNASGKRAFFVLRRGTGAEVRKFTVKQVEPESDLEDFMKAIPLGAEVIEND